LADGDDIIAHHAAGTPPELFVERMHRHRSDEIGKAFRATLMTLHNDGTIDALEPRARSGLLPSTSTSSSPSCMSIAI
jgi:hypothetical protein